MTRTAIALPLVAALAGCGGSAGSLDLNLWGEDYIVREVPALSGSSPGFENGWSIHYSKFLVNLGAIRFASSDGSNANAPTGFRVYDLHLAAQPVRITSLSALNPVRYDDVSYTLAPASEASTAASASAADLTLMRTNRYAVYMEAEARRAGQMPITLRWGFGGTTAFTDCHDAMNQPGFTVPSGGRATVQLTLHGDHPFYDDLQSETARLRFDLIAAADTDMDREVTLDELAAVDLTRAPAGQYGVGSARDVNNLRQFVTALVSTVGHFNGEGQCTERRSP